MALIWDPELQQYVDDGSQGGQGGGTVVGSNQPPDPFGYSKGGPGSSNILGPGVNFPDTGNAAGHDQARRDMLQQHAQDKLGRPLSDAELTEALRHYYGAGGDTARANIESIGWSPESASEMPYDFWGGVPDRPEYEPLPDFEFSAPTQQDLYADPSYIGRRDEGRQVLEQSASGKGTLRTGGTLKDILTYGQNFASREYGNVYDRRFQEAKAKYEPKVMSWQARNRVNELEFNRLFDKAMAELDDNYRYVTLGATI